MRSRARRPTRLRRPSRPRARGIRSPLRLRLRNPLAVREVVLRPRRVQADKLIADGLARRPGERLARGLADALLGYRQEELRPEQPVPERHCTLLGERSVEHEPERVLVGTLLALIHVQLEIRRLGAFDVEDELEIAHRALDPEDVIHHGTAIATKRPGDDNGEVHVARPWIEAPDRARADEVRLHDGNVRLDRVENVLHVRLGPGVEVADRRRAQPSYTRRPSATVARTFPLSVLPSSHELTERDRKPRSVTCHLAFPSSSTRFAGAPTAMRGGARPYARAGPADMHSSNVSSRSEEHTSELQSRE